MILKYTRRAERDLEEIADWIAIDDRLRAVSYVADIRATCRALLDYPRAFPKVAGRPGTHRCLHGTYLICYRIGRDHITIARIVHGARD